MKIHQNLVFHAFHPSLHISTRHASGETGLMCRLKRKCARQIPHNDHQDDTAQERCDDDADDALSLKNSYQ